MICVGSDEDNSNLFNYKSKTNVCSDVITLQRLDCWFSQNDHEDKMKRNQFAICMF